MKKLICFLVLILITTTQSQSIMRIWKNGVIIDSVAVTNDLKITFGTGGGGFVCGNPITYFGKTYNTVLIGSQCWLKENLNVGIFVESVSTLSNHTDASNNGIIEKYCYNNDTLNCNTYGGLYDWNEAMQYITTPGTQGICPTGWHIPTLAELQTLKSAVGNNANALKAIGQGSGGGVGTNTSGFSALLAGYRYTTGHFTTLGGFTYFWSSTTLINNGYHAYCLNLWYGVNDIGMEYYNINYGYSVRCLKD
ncbi:MAG: FISUMP domain-containing protein [Ignavibacteria bacterium]|nr:FISUMP domain-containing protein [Ignavibacteria bacterium]